MEINLYEVAVIPIISGLVQVCKELGIHNKYCSLVSIIFGLFFGLFYIEPFDFKNGILIGIIIGLSASGLYSGTKTIQETIKGVKNDQQ